MRRCFAIVPLAFWQFPHVVWKVPPHLFVPGQLQLHFLQLPHRDWQSLPLLPQVLFGVEVFGLLIPLFVKQVHLYHY